MANHAQYFRMLSLPLELRENIYLEYLMDYPVCDVDLSSLILLISKQVSEEVLNVYQRRGKFTYRITHRHAGFLDLSLACLKSWGQEVDYSYLQHLIIEILPPPPGKVFSMITIVQHIRKFATNFAPKSRLQHLSVSFLENDLVSLQSRPTEIAKTFPTSGIASSHLQH